jgi:hypothetical protein
MLARRFAFSCMVSIPVSSISNRGTPSPAAKEKRFTFDDVFVMVLIFSHVCLRDAIVFILPHFIVNVDRDDACVGN